MAGLDFRLTGDGTDISPSSISFSAASFDYSSFVGTELIHAFCILYYLDFYRPLSSTKEGNVYTWVCLSVHREGT